MRAWTLFIVALAGCAAAPVRSRAAISADENALLVLERALDVAPGYEAAWRAARAAFLVADEAREKSRRRAFAERGVGFARRAIDFDDASVQGHYYLSINLGLVASTRTVGALDLLPEMAREAERAATLDERFDHGGPHRLLGTLKARAPAWPTSVGDVDDAVEHLRRAIELDPAYPPNHLYLAEALLKAKQPEAARVELEAVAAARPAAEWAKSLARWQAEAVALRRQIRK